MNPLIVAQFMLLIPLFDQHIADSLLFDCEHYPPLAQKRQYFKEDLIGDKRGDKATARGRMQLAVAVGSYRQA
jgi:hypothetical protein